MLWPHRPGAASRRSSAAIRNAPRAIRLRLIRQQVARHVQQQRSPRVFMLLSMALIGLLMLVSSVALHWAGVALLWLRYALVWCLGYGLFFVLLRAWLYQESLDLPDGGDALEALMPDGSAPLQAYSGGGGQTAGGGASGHWIAEGPQVHGAVPDADWSVGDLGDAGDVGEGLPLLLVLLVGLVLVLGVGGLLYAVVGLVQGAPYLLTEVLLDALIAAGFYRRYAVARDAGQHWALTAWQHTWKLFVGGLLTIGLLGLVLAWLPVPVPVHSLGELLQWLF